MRWPLRYDPAPETRNRTTSATSSGWQTRPNGMAALQRADVLDTAGLDQATPHLRLHQAGGDDVHVDVVALLLLGEGPGQRLHGRLGHRVRRAAGGVAVGRDGRDEDDVAARLLSHRRQHQPAEVVRTHRVRPEEVLDLAWIGVGHAPPARGDARVVHQDVDPVEVAEDRAHHPLVVLQRIDRRLVRDRSPTQRLDLAHRVLCRRFVLAEVHGHVDAIGRQPQADRPADASTSPSDESHTLTRVRCHGTAS